MRGVNERVQKIAEAAPRVCVPANEVSELDFFLGDITQMPLLA